MPRRIRKRPNWPYRWAWFSMLAFLALYIAVQTVRGALTFGHRAHGSDWTLAFVAALLDATFAVWFVAVGASIGSFLNVVAFRLPRGRHIGGHSGCFYCQTPIEGRDNVPVLAWIKLRGRCRTCRLPISIQYPLVELAVALVFLFVYLSEFSSSGTNLPGTPVPMWGGLMRIAVNTTLVLRVTTYLLTLCGLIAAALIAVRGQAVPLKLFLWTLVPWLLAVLAQPEAIVVKWRESVPPGAFESRLDALITILCGTVAAIALARLLAPILYPVFDRRLLRSDQATDQARQWLGGMAVAGALVGWQAVVPMAWCIALAAGLSILLLRRYRHLAELRDWTVWIWLGLLIFRANWSWLEDFQVLPAAVPAVVRHVIGALLLAPVAWLLRRPASPSASGGNAESTMELEEEN